MVNSEKSGLPMVDEQSEGRFLVVEVSGPNYTGLKRSALENDLDFLWRDTGYATFGLTTSDHINAMAWAAAQSGVLRVWRQESEAVLSGRTWRPSDTIIQVGDAAIGGNGVAVIAGPCSVEDKSQMMEVAACLRETGASWLRGGAFKPRTSPYRFQGLGRKGLEYLKLASEEYGLPVVTEVMSIEEIEVVCEHSDVLQVGSRNAQNFPLLKALGSSGKPVLLKRGFGCFIDELLHAAEYLMSYGNPQVLVCERGIRSHEPSSRFTFDINAIPVLKSATHLPVVADTAHGTGNVDLVGPIAKAAIAAGADALMFEIHPHPALSYSDADQTLSLEQFAALMPEMAAVAGAVGRRLDGTDRA
ncbi:MAG: 3-deoxy-7-phosphoheptulonate synthase [Gemmatimonadales bacterium]|nr:3-deoxy-7-phosphoheptulonate synthase [Gemmatimonadales bacterium]